ncbi:alpha beta-hydrolase [Fusarium albosuccineum]|uniref:Carboxylic ester hydrolase n=1 Tax=Fusarium albosuccineum TaxID=1237068 RepID=A0A8H4KEA2_9HYPO|nr:alpha beta-hydrolase [Fusarium albosuccineum]
MLLPRTFIWGILASLVSGRDLNRSNELLIHSPNFSVRGSYAANVSTPVRQFLGIPYAEPPVGQHRFKSPKTKTPYQETLNATAFGSVCMQYDTGAPSVFSEYLPGQRVSVGMSEDCLTLNIWAPQASDIGDELLPVLIWIPGGALVSGGSAVPNTNGARFVESQKMIIISLNYRANIFGFPGAAGLDGRHLNPGLLDQRKAVEWIYDNIAYFGGDPTKMTLFGQSAGGSSTDFWTYAWPDDPLVRGFIVMSGAVGNNQFAMNRTDNFTYVTEQIGYGDMSKDDELRCIQETNGTEIIEVYNKYNASENEGAMLAFGAMADDETIFTNWTERRDRGLVSRLPMLIGSTSNDYSSLYSPFDGSAPNQTEVGLLTDEVFNCRARIASQARHNLNSSIWRYRYYGEWPNLNPLPWLGAYHASDIPMVFGTSDLYGGSNTPEEADWSKYMQAAWAAFTKDPKHGLTRLGWPRYNEDEKTLVKLGVDGSARVVLAPGSEGDEGCGPGVG